MALRGVRSCHSGLKSSKMHQCTRGDSIFIKVRHGDMDIDQRCRHLAQCTGMQSQSYHHGRCRNILCCMLIRLSGTDTSQWRNLRTSSRSSRGITCELVQTRSSNSNSINVRQRLSSSISHSLSDRDNVIYIITAKWQTKIHESSAHSHETATVNPAPCFDSSVCVEAHISLFPYVCTCQ